MILAASRSAAGFIREQLARPAGRLGGIFAELEILKGGVVLGLWVLERLEARHELVAAGDDGVEVDVRNIICLS
jgi:hypothetical protein